MCIELWTNFCATYPCPALRAIIVDLYVQCSRSGVRRVRHLSSWVGLGYSVQLGISAWPIPTSRILAKSRNQGPYQSYHLCRITLLCPIIRTDPIQNRAVSHGPPYAPATLKCCPAYPSLARYCLYLENLT
jgi:hypothetical protein